MKRLPSRVGCIVHSSRPFLSWIRKCGSDGEDTRGEGGEKKPAGRMEVSPWLIFQDDITYSESVFRLTTENFHDLCED